MITRRTFEDLVAEARCHVDEIDHDELASALGDAARAPLVIDVREACERRLGHIPGSVHLARGVLERDLARKAFRGFVREADLTRPIVVHCAGGARSMLAAMTLKMMGFTSVLSLRGGFGAWAGAGRPVGVDRRPWEAFAAYAAIENA